MGATEDEIIEWRRIEGATEDRKQKRGEQGRGWSWTQGVNRKGRQRLVNEML